MAEIYLMAYGLWRCQKLWELGMGMGKFEKLANSYSNLKTFSKFI